jgi:hypothetical protein
LRGQKQNIESVQTLGSSKRLVRRLLLYLEILFGIAAIAVYLAAKVHFFTAYRPDNVSVYLKQHWPFWAALATIAVAIGAIEAIRRRLQPACKGNGR